MSISEAPDRSRGTAAHVDWRSAHEELEHLAKIRAGLDYQEGRAMLAALRAGTHTKLGYASFVEYIERLFGYKPRWTEERLRVAEALEVLPELGQALRDGALSWSAMRELSRVANPETESEWLDAARGKSLRQIERSVSGRKPGDRPSSPPDPSLVKHVLRFEVTAATLATFRDAMGELRRKAGQKLDDDSALLAMARHVLQGPADEGRSSYQIVVTICDECRRGFQTGAGVAVELESEAVEMAKCDGQHIGSTHVGAMSHSAPSSGSEKQRATQSVPPKIRRLVLRRDHGRCVVPGCRHTAFVDVHHLDLRSEGGNHDPDRLVTICGVHHRASHEGRLIIEGRVSAGLSFKHADGASYGSAVSPVSIDLFAKAFDGLRQMGFRETETKRALEAIRQKSHVGERSLEQILRDALGVLAERRFGPMPVKAHAPS